MGLPENPRRTPPSRPQKSPRQRSGPSRATQAGNRHLRGRDLWSEFIRSQAKTVIAADFFTMDTVLRRRFYVLFFIEVDTKDDFTPSR